VASPEDQIDRLERRLERERRTRREAERIAEHTTSSLYDRQRELELLEAVAAASNQASTLEEALGIAIERVCLHTRWPLGHAFLVGPAGELTSSKVWHLEDPVRFPHFRQVSEEWTFAPGQGLPGRVVATGRPAWIVDTERDEDFPRLAAESGVRGAFAFPVLLGTEVVAVVEIFNDRPTEVDRGLLKIAVQLGGQLGRVVERSRAREQITHQGLHDGLTGLPNRLLFLDRLTGALARSSRRGALTAVLFIDLDRFKVINDSSGHRVGDRVLVEVASRLDTAIRPGDTIARLGGDEFVILCENLEDEREALRVAERLQLQLLRPFNAQEGERHVVTSSIGVAIGAADTDAEALVHDADVAMYRAKDLGRARHELFDAAMRDRVLGRFRTERALRRALDRGELRLHYQPIVRLADRTHGEGVEALIRWEDSERGLVSPAEFIPLGEACRQAAAWRSEIGDGAPLPINVNLSARQLGQADLPRLVERALVNASLDPADLGLEITESALIENAEVPARTLADLRALGVRVQLDDFGTGYSSLSYLQRFPVDGLKIDRTFIAGLGERPDASAIVGAIIAMGHALGLTIVAEGIETEAQADEAQRLGCDSGQGYLFGAPRPPAAAAMAAAIAAR